MTRRCPMFSMVSLKRRLHLFLVKVINLECRYLESRKRGSRINLEPSRISLRGVCNTVYVFVGGSGWVWAVGA